MHAYHAMPPGTGQQVATLDEHEVGATGGSGGDAAVESVERDTISRLDAVLLDAPAAAPGDEPDCGTAATATSSFLIEHTPAFFEQVAGAAASNERYAALVQSNTVAGTFRHAMEADWAGRDTPTTTRCMRTLPQVTVHKPAAAYMAPSHSSPIPVAVSTRRCRHPSAYITATDHDNDYDPLAVAGSSSDGGESILPLCLSHHDPGTSEQCPVNVSVHVLSSYLSEDQLLALVCAMRAKAAANARFRAGNLRSAEHVYVATIHAVLPASFLDAAVDAQHQDSHDARAAPPTGSASGSMSLMLHFQRLVLKANGATPIEPNVLLNRAAA
ncbi:hypothetical protein K437DRAFT_263766 [Tilletiaria anomala UBC 951]|uniref:Uncharacterized protein n=1 Tax=Tilletiaria anomala (strain ATCC 24038 / CBS 436.72 / UBC 951) TaxID=1037660 RepID=A0A066VUM7_TILAU|nr:uncharacterized protein K437DRAFT_263766 [Tilletiaria anomala UBC 951]KDN42514.1 hypothetical protein K437DRAFT_263766 [Tilletiaria anomala UBC 951]